MNEMWTVNTFYLNRYAKHVMAVEWNQRGVYWKWFERLSTVNNIDEITDGLALPLPRKETDGWQLLLCGFIYPFNSNDDRKFQNDFFNTV